MGNTILLGAYLLALGCWIGAMVFFGTIVAPVMFSRLAIADAGKVVAGVFPRYYAFAYMLGGLALVLSGYFLAVNFRGGRMLWVLVSLSLAISLAVTLYAGLVVRPQVDAVRTVVEQEHPDPARKALFDRLHRLSVRLNSFSLLLNTLALVGTAAALNSRG